MTELPEGERRDLQQAARETGERMGSMDTLIGIHGQRLDLINGSMGKVATELATMTTAMALQTKSLTAIEKTLEGKVVSLDAQVAGILSQMAEQRGSTNTAFAGKQRSLQWWLAVFAAVIAMTIAAATAFVTVAVAIVVLIANGSF